MGWLAAWLLGRMLTGRLGRMRTIRLSPCMLLRLAIRFALGLGRWLEAKAQELIAE